MGAAKRYGGGGYKGHVPLSLGLECPLDVLVGGVHILDNAFWNFGSYALSLNETVTYVAIGTVLFYFNASCV